MTDDLTTLMHDRADGRDFALPNLDTIVSDGDRRLRRRRLGVTAGIAALAIAGVGVVVSVTGDAGGGDGTPPVADAAEIAAAEPLDTDVVSWATGSVIHTPDSTIDVGHRVTSYVRTAVGYVVSDEAGTVYAVDGAGAQEVGTVSDDGRRLVSDPRGTLVGWVDATGDRPAFVVLDQATGQVTRDDSHTTPGASLLADEEDPVFFYAIDGTTAYWLDERGAVAVDATSGDVRVVEADAANGFDIAGAGSGQIAFSTDAGLTIGTSVESARRFDQVYGSVVTFSPDGRYFSADADELQVYDVQSGAQVDVGLDRGFATGYAWLDDGSLLVGAAEQAQDESEIELWTCSVPAGDCERLDVDLGTFTEFGATGAFPTGETVAD